MGNFSDAAVAKILDAYFGGAALSPPSMFYVGLSTENPTNDASGNAEPDASTGYERVEVANIGANWQTAADRIKSNNIPVSFPEATDDWGTVTHFTIWKHATSVALADFICWGELAPELLVASGGAPYFSQSTLAIVAVGS